MKQPSLYCLLPVYPAFTGYIPPLAENSVRHKTLPRITEAKGRYAGRIEMRKRIHGPVSPLLLGGATFALFASLLALHKLGIVDWRIFWHFWMPLLVIVG
jgi:hypothetical protein